MNVRKFLLAALAGFVSNGIAYGILLVLLGGYFESAVLGPAGASTEGSVVLPTIASVTMALIMAYIYPKGYEGGSPLSEGLRFGIAMGLFFGIPYAFYFGSMYPIAVGALVVFALGTALETAAGGLAIGLVYGRLK
jgi:hypothetical protein